MKKTTLVLISVLLIFSCRKDDSENFDGPDLNDLFGPFSIIQEIEVNKKTADFPVDNTLHFTGELSKNTDWVISITGASTGAKRSISGTQRVISADNSTWDGGANSFPGFGIETAYIEISFPKEEGSPILYDTVSITGSKVDAGYLITSFENGEGANWSKFNQSTVQGKIDCGSGESAKGNCHYSFTGNVPWDWAIGSVMIQPSTANFGLPASASNLFFNMAFKPIENSGTGNTFIQFWFDEDENGDGTFDLATEDRFIYEYWFEDTGWNLISYKYSDIQFDVDGNKVSTNGNGLPEPGKLMSINVFYLANKDNGLAKAYIDHLIFTTNKPYTP
ncbi:MAG: hypothetical protein QMC21_04020 [Flavobacteriales bacterium]|jgi:hypothetical protein|tara:strand:+ start:7634 stop:8635 length:1002 start_codon:yes stop_codon:yes gene_type:complete